MKFNKFTYASILTRAVVASLTLVAGGIAEAATDTWTGASSTDFSVGANYVGSPTIATGDILVFGSTSGSGTTLTDAGTLSLGGITFNSGALAYTLTGNSLTLTGGVTNNGTSLETINNAIAMTAAQTFTMNGGNITLGGNITGTGGGITTAGTGTLTLSGTDSYTGATTINSGALNVTGTLSGGGGLVFGGTGTFTASNTFSLGALTLNSGVGTVSAASGKTLTLTGITHGTGSLVDFVTTGAIKTTFTDVNSIVGPWAFTGTGTSLKYAVAGSGTSVSITGLTGTAGGTNLASVTSATGNYTYSAAETVAANLTGNTLQYTGGATTTALSGFTLTLNGLMNTGTGLLTITNSGSGTLAIGSAGELDIISDSNGISISSSITGTGALVFGGPQGTTGTLSLGSTVNSFTGTTYIDSGTLMLSGGGRLNSGSSANAINIANGATFIDASTNAQILSGVISGSGNIIDNSTATLSINGLSNTFSGTTTIGAGATLAFGSGSTGGLASSTIVFAGNGVLTSNATTSVAGVTFDSGVFGEVNESARNGKTFTLGSITRSGAGGMAIFDIASANPSGTSTFTTTTTNTNGILGTWAIYATDPTGVPTNVPTIGYAAVSAGTITTLTGTAAGTNFANVNSSTGNYATANATNVNSSPLTANTLQFNGTAAQSWTNTGGGMTLNGLLYTGTGGLTESGGTLQAATAGGELDVITNAQNITLGSAIVDNTSASSLAFGSASLNATTAALTLGTGSLTLTGINTYTGATYVDSGTLIIGGAGQLGSGNYAGAISLSNSGTLNYNSTAAQNLSGVISGLGSVVQSGSGTLTLSGVNTYTGGTTVTGSTLILANTGNLASTGPVTIGTGGTFQLGTTGAAFTTPTAYDLVFTGTGSIIDGTGSGSTLTVSSIGDDPVLSSATPGGAIQVASGATGTIAAGVTVQQASSAGASSLFIDGTSTATLPPSSLGILNIAGTVETTGGNLNVVDAIVNVEAGGSLISASEIQTGSGAGAPATGFNEFINVSGGTATATNGVIIQNGQSAATAYSAITLGLGGTGGILNASGGNVAFGRSANVGNAYFYLDSGTLSTKEVVGNAVSTGSQDAFFFNGGTLQASANNATFITGIGANADVTPISTVGDTGGMGTVLGTLSGGGGVYVGGNNGIGGAVIDSHGFTIGIAQVLLSGVGNWGSSADLATIDGGLTKEGLGTLLLSGENTYNGGTTITAGTLEVGVGISGTSSALGATTGNLTVTGGTLDLFGFDTTVGNVTLGDVGNDGSTLADSVGSNTLTVTSGDTVTVTGTGNTINSTVTVAGNTTLSSGAALALNGQITGNVAVGTGGAVLSGSGTVNGNATLTGTGIVNFSNPGNITGTLGVTGGNWNGAGSVGGLVTSSSGNFNIGSGANLTATSGVDVTGGTISSTDATGTITGGVVYTSSSNSTFAGVIAGGANSLTMNSSGATLTLTGANTYGGGTLISAGTLAMATSSASGSLGGGDLTVNGSGVLDLEATTQTVDGLNGTGTITNLYTNGRSDPSSLIIGNGGDSGSFSGTIQDGDLSNTSLTKEGAGTQVLSGENQYSGGTTITGGILSVASEDNLGNASGYFASISFTPQITLGGGELLTTATTPITEGVILNAGATNTLAASTGTTATYSGVIQDATTLGALNVGDSHGNNGTVVLSNANTYTGGTTVASGTLQVANGTTGSATGSGALTVASTGTLVGIGTTVSSSFSIAGNVIAGSGAPSDTTGQTVIEGAAVLHNSNFTNAKLSFNLDTGSLNSTSINVGATGIDFGSTTLSLTLQGGSAVALKSNYVLIAGVNSSSLAGVDGSQYSGFTTDASGADGLLSGQYKILSGLDLSFVNDGSIYGPGSFLFLNTVGGVDDIEVEVVPEPGTWALMLGGVALLVFWQRRKNKEW